MMEMGEKEIVRIGTRGSELARVQTRSVIELLESHHPEITFETVVRKTTGDRFDNRSIHDIPGKGFFTRDLDEAVLQEDVDAAIHSAKDVPTEIPPGLSNMAVPQRVSPADVLVSRDDIPLEELPQGARVGTSSLRRKAQILNRCPQLDVVEIRGNVDTRLEKLFDREEVEALVLAKAGLERLGRTDVVTQTLSLKHHVPAPGQGALLVQAREEDNYTESLFRKIDDETASFQIWMERRIVRELDGGCRIPLGAICSGSKEEGFTLAAMVGSSDGRQHILEQRTFDTREEGREMVMEVVQDLKKGGAVELIEKARQHLED